MNKRILKLRRSLGLSQEEFAKSVNSTRPTVSKWERGLNAPNADAIIQICTNHKVRANWLLFEQGVMHEEPSGGKPEPSKPSPKRAPGLALMETQDRTKERVGGWHTSEGDVDGLSLESLIRQVEYLSATAHQPRWVKLLGHISTEGKIDLVTLAAREGNNTEQVRVDCEVLARLGLVKISVDDKAMWFEVTEQSPNMHGGSPLDGGALAKHTVDALMRSVLPKADRRDGTGGLVYAEAWVKDGKALLREMYASVRSVWKKAEAEGRDGVGDKVTILLAAGVDLEVTK